ncbi:substrate-binding domain-containing protein, partial [Cupriavidus sp. 2KB_15]|uniref:substrate-binding domain-containing protein n=1 Tax=Cupriavidus sp. 2KB_15 TaxID=3232976 RepID=UPI003F9248ED
LSGLEAGDRLLGLPEPPTAIFAANDSMAMGVMSAASKRGLSVPGDLSVVGFDDGPLAESSWPGLTTVHQPIAEMAEAATEMLIEGFGDPRFRSRTAARQLDYHIVERGSSASR